jgi:hypothetical protein
MRPHLKRIIFGGMAGTALMTLMMRFLAPMMIGHPMDIAALLGNMMGNSWVLGMLAHSVNGIVIFPLAYVFVAYRFLSGPPLIRGMLWGIVLWLAAESMVMPMAGAGFFSSEIGGIKAAVAAFLGHLAYGAVFGFIAAGTEAHVPERVQRRA